MTKANKASVEALALIWARVYYLFFGRCFGRWSRAIISMWDVFQAESLAGNLAEIHRNSASFDLKEFTPDFI